jgi:uncharacterized protein (DUF2225 family)
MSRVAVNHVRSFSKGTVLFSAGEQASSLYFILEGRVLAVKEQQQVALGPGGFLGAVPFFEESPHIYTAICTTEVTALTFTRENSRDLVAKQPLIALSLLRELALQVPQTEELVFIQGRQDEPAQTTSDQELLPAGHPALEGTVPLEYGDLLFSSEVDCPVCETRFTATRTRTSRLQLEEQKPDFRNVYRNFEPNFFYLWVCPQCLFTYPERQYNRVPQRVVHRWKAAVAANPPKASFEFDTPRTLQQVFASYFLAMKTYEAVGAGPELWANLWLRLLWMYEDLEEEEWARKAAEQARKYFAESLATTARSAAGDQRVYLILGELDLRLGDRAEAFRNFHAAATITGGDPRTKRLASDRIQSLRAQ